jgi:hypothetical protein
MLVTRHGVRAGKWIYCTLALLWLITYLVSYYSIHHIISVYTACHRIMATNNVYSSASAFASLPAGSCLIANPFLQLTCWISTYLWLSTWMVVLLYNLSTDCIENTTSNSSSIVISASSTAEICLPSHCLTMDQVIISQYYGNYIFSSISVLMQQ